MTITLANVAAPTSPTLAEQSRANLERLAGKTIRIEHHGLLRATGETQSTPGDACQRRLDNEEAKATAEAPEARGPIVGTVYGEAGGCLQVEQLMAGMVKATDGASAEWRRVEATARKKKLGLWAINE